MCFQSAAKRDRERARTSKVAIVVKLWHVADLALTNGSFTELLLGNFRSNVCSHQHGAVHTETCTDYIRYQLEATFFHIKTLSHHTL